MPDASPGTRASSLGEKKVVDENNGSEGGMISRRGGLDAERYGGTCGSLITVEYRGGRSSGFHVDS